ncbi:MAG TPA: ATP-binding cassette domain-containing protein [Acidimicrobiia bacterium]|nr:ATP-binding cassette domain-containing protein [Acidimicrobiia bacterium]
MTLAISDITKRFGNLVANDDISLDLGAGTLHAVLGENGAGKSTLMKILSGVFSPDAGSITVDGAAIKPGSPRAALAAGIGMLYQEPLVCLPFTAAENFRLGSRRSVRTARDDLVDTSRRFGFRLGPSVLARNLSIGERQQLEIVRLLAAGVRVLILDEPTSGITADQRQTLFAALRRLAAEGLTVLFVSHKLAEVNELCRSVTVLRRGRVVGSSALPRPESELVRMMFEEGASLPARSPVVARGGVVAELDSVDAGDGRTGIRGAHLRIRRGEVVGLAGLEGSGQSALLRALAGVAPIRRGRFRIAGRDMIGRRQRSFAESGVALLPGGRLEEGLLPGLTIAEHLALAAAPPWIINWRDAQARAVEAIAAFRIKGRADSTADELSGGNQQRLLLSLLPARLQLLLMEHPTRGLDLDSASYIWARLLDRRRDGTAIVFSSADLDELLTYADRVIVCFEGRLIAERTASETSVDEIGTLIGGSVAVGAL